MPTLRERGLMEQEVYYQQGLTNRQNGDRQRAIEDLTRALQIDPDFADAYYHRGLTYYDAGELHNAAFDYTQAIQRLPDRPDYHYARALVRLALKNLPGALEDVERTIALDCNYAPAYNLRGIVLRKSNHISGAIASFKQAAELYLAQKDAASARRCLEKIKPLQPRVVVQNPVPLGVPSDVRSAASADRPQDFYAQMLAQAEQGDASSVLRELNWVLQLDDRDARAYCCRGVIHSQIGDARAAISDFNQALRLNPQDAIAYRHRGTVRLQLGDFGGAVEDLNRAMQIAPQDARLLMARGNAHREMGNYSRAIADYTEALQLAPEAAEVYQHRALVYTRLEEVDKALADYQIAATRYCEREDWENYQTMLDRLQQLRSVTPQSKAVNPGGNPLRQHLLKLVGGQAEIAERLLEQAKYCYPGMSEDWYIEKAIYDIERDRDWE
jgi:tetratricopeptide (TPR) repeat protein